MYILLWDEATRFPRFRLSSFVFSVFILLLPQFPKISSGIAYFLRHAQRRMYYNSNIDYNFFVVPSTYDHRRRINTGSRLLSTR